MPEWLPPPLARSRVTRDRLTGPGIEIISLMSPGTAHLRICVIRLMASRKNGRSPPPINAPSLGSRREDGRSATSSRRRTDIAAGRLRVERRVYARSLRHHVRGRCTDTSNTKGVAGDSPRRDRRRRRSSSFRRVGRQDGGTKLIKIHTWWYTRWWGRDHAGSS